MMVEILLFGELEDISSRLKYLKYFTSNCHKETVLITVCINVYWIAKKLKIPRKVLLALNLLCLYYGIEKVKQFDISEIANYSYHRNNQFLNFKMG